MVIGGDGVFVRDLSQLLDVLEISARDVDVEEDILAVAVLFFDQILKIAANRGERLGQAGLFVHYVDGEVESGHSGIGEPIDYIRGAAIARWWRRKAKSPFFAA